MFFSQFSSKCFFMMKWMSGHVTVSESVLAYNTQYFFLEMEFTCSLQKVMFQGILIHKLLDSFFHWTHEITFQWSYWLYTICKINEHYLQSYQLHLSLGTMIFTNLNLHYVITCKCFHVNLGFYGQMVFVEKIFKWPHPTFALLWLFSLWIGPATIFQQT